MRILLFIPMLLLCMAPVHAAVNLAVSKQSGPAVLEQASQLARQLGNGLGTAVNVVELPDAGEVEAWLNRYATAELALVESGYVSGKPGQFVVIGPVGHDLLSAAGYFRRSAAAPCRRAGGRKRPASG